MKRLKSQFKIESCGNICQFLILAILFSLPFYFIKFKYSWMSLNLTEALIILLFLCWIISKEKKFPILNNRNLIPIGLILVGVMSSILINKNYYIGFGILKGWFFLPLVFAVILFDRLKKDPGLLDNIFVSLFASGILVSIIGIYYKLSGFLTYDGRLRIFYDSPNQLAMFLAPVFLIGVIKFGFKELPRFYQGKGKAELWKSGLKVVGIFLMASNLYLTKSYGAWLSVGVVIAVVFWLEYVALLNKKYFSISLFILFILLGWASFAKYNSIEKLGERSSLASRAMIWKSAGLMIKNNPLFGVGPGNFQNKYLEYQKYFPPYLEWSVPQPHNLFLAFWLEAGLTGIIGFIWLLALFFRDNKKVYSFTKINKYNNSIDEIKKQTGDSLDDKEYFGGEAIPNNYSYGILCLALVLYFIFHGLIDTTYWRNDMAVVFWLVISLNLYLTFRKDEEVGRTSNS
jgi:O-antigen ligase